MSLKLVILGLLLEGDKHPYEIQHIMKEREMDYYIKLAKGSLYYAFEQLEKQGCIKISDIIRDTNRPDKTIYHITQKGEAEFQKLLLAQFQEKNHVYKPIYAALAFATLGNEHEIVSIIDNKIKETKNFLQIIQTVYNKKIATVPRAQLHILAGVIEHVYTELRWLIRLREDAVHNRLSDVGTAIDDLRIENETAT
ncbi:PadR family transcriptional regulator [Microbacteriaceae bacterium 4G12]